MDDCSPTHTFPNLHLHQPLPFHLVSPRHPSSEPGHASPRLPPPSPACHGDFQPLGPGEDIGVGDLNSLDGDMSVGSHFEGDARPLWFCDIQKDDWNENIQNPTDEYYVNTNCFRGRRGLTSFSSCSHLTYNRKVGYLTKHATFCRDGGSVHAGLDDFGDSSALNEGQFPALDIDTNLWQSKLGESRWGGEQCPSSVRTDTQKLDSFSDAFMSQTKRRLPVITNADAQSWNDTVRLSSYHSDSLSPSLPLFPSPPTSNLLSPPPTPLPPTSYSPTKADSLGGGGLLVHAGVVPAGEAVEALQFFPVRSQSLLPQNPAGMVWRLPLLSHCFTPLAEDVSGPGGNARPAIPSNTGPNSIDQYSPHLPGLQSATSLHSFFHPTSLGSLSSNHQDEGHTAQQRPSVFRSSGQDPGCPVNATFPSMLQRRGRHKRTRFTPRPQLNPSRKGTGLYSSICRSEHRDEPDVSDALSPQINIGPDFQAEIPSCSFDDWTEPYDEEKSPMEQLLWKPWDELCCNTVVQEQVEKLLQMSSSSCLPGGGTNTELALHCLHRNHGDVMATLQVLLSSQPMPPGDYHYPGADVWTEREKCLFSAALETHGKDLSLVQTLVKTKTVGQCVEFFYLTKKLEDKQKTCTAWVEDTNEEEQPQRASPTCQPITRQIRLESPVFAPSLAGFFPCKLCGKMFYKIKSRNAHMKIHRQPQEQWTERKLQQQTLSHRASGLIIQPQTLTLNGKVVANGNGNNVTSPGNLVAYSNGTSHVIPGMNTGGQTSEEPNGVLQFPTLWSNSGQASPFYCSADVKAEAEGGGAGFGKWK